jgi:tetratricopeptide (TPR) repeat protein
MENAAEVNSTGERTAARRPAWTAWAVAALVAAAAFTMALKPLRSPDVWHHVGCGRLVAELGGPARADVFSCTAQGQRWVQYEWLAQWAFYEVHRFGGVTGLILFRAGVIALTALVLLWACRVRGTPWPACGVALAMALTAASGRFFTRPEIFTWLWLAGCMVSLELLRRGRHRLFFVPALMIVPWVNMHGAWPAGLALLGLTCGGETLLAWLRAREAFARLPFVGGHEPLPRRTIGVLWAAFGLAAAATLANPFGVHIWEVPFKLASMPDVHRVIAEWRRPGLAHWLDPQHFGAYVALMACVLAWRALRLTDALVVAFFGLLSLTAVRHIAVAMLVIAPVTAALLAVLWARAAARAPKLQALGRPGCSVAATAVLCALCAWLALGPRFERFGVRLDERVYPLDAAAFLERNELDGNLFNSYTYGNYLLYARHPHNRVFIDGRVDMYGPEPLRLFERVLTAAPDWADILRKYDVDLCVIEIARPPEPAILRALHRSRDWALVYWDELSAVYVRRTEARREFLARAYVYSVYPRDFDPALAATPERLRKAEQDYRRRLAEDPRSVMALYGLGRCLEARGESMDAMSFYRDAVAIDPAAETVWYAMGICAMKMGAFGGAEPSFRRVLALNPTSTQAMLALSAVLLQRGQVDAAEAECLRATRTDPGNWKAHASLARICEKRGDLARALAAAEQAARVEDNADTRALVTALKGKKNGTK